MTTETNTIETTFEIVPADSGLELAAKNSLELAFSGFFADAAKWKAHAETITEPKLARTARLELKSLRVAAEKVRKEMKEDSLRMGRAIDGANNILLSLIVPIEKSLEEIEKAEERRIAAAIAALQSSRADELVSLEYAPIPENLGVMEEDKWAQLLQTAADLLEMRKERERKAEEERQAAIKKEAEEREAQRLENLRLKEEAEKAAAALAAAKAEREAAEKAHREEVRKAQEAAKAEREKIEAAAAEERRKALEAAAVAAKEKAAAEAESKALRDAEEKRIAAAEAKVKADAAAAKKAAAAPDKAKLQEFAHTVRALVVPDVKSEESKAVRSDILAKVAAFAAWIETQAAAI